MRPRWLSTVTAARQGPPLISSSTYLTMHRGCGKLLLFKGLVCHTIQRKEPGKKKGKMPALYPRSRCGLLSTTSIPGDGYHAFFLPSLCIGYPWKDPLVTPCSHQPQSLPDNLTIMCVSTSCLSASIISNEELRFPSKVILCLVLKLNFFCISRARFTGRTETLQSLRGVICVRLPITLKHVEMASPRHALAACS